MRLSTPVDLGAALASETLSASDMPAMIKAALYIMTSFQFGRTNDVALKKFPMLAIYGAHKACPNLALFGPEAMSGLSPQIRRLADMRRARSRTSIYEYTP